MGSNMEGAEEIGKPLEPQVIKEVKFAPHLTYEQAQQLAEGIPTFSDRDPNNPEWLPTPVIALDLSQYHLGYVLIKNEADRRSNPTGTMKDRPAWEIATFYRTYGQGIVEDVESGKLERSVVTELVTPSVAFITSGNEGKAVSERLALYKELGVPPPDLLVDTHMPQVYIEVLKSLYANIYAFDLSKQELTTADIHVLTELKRGGSISCIDIVNAQSIFYDWLAHEIFNENPTAIYVPYGTGRLFENLLHWQYMTWRNSLIDKDPRLTTHPKHVRHMSVLGAEPAKPDSMAMMLTAAFKPFLLFKDEDCAFARDFRITGNNTSRYKVKEEFIQEAYEILRSKGIDTEPSAAASLGLYMQRVREGTQKPGDLEKNRVLIVNTGGGIDGLEVKSQTEL